MTNHATYLDYLKGTSGGLVRVKLSAACERPRPRPRRASNIARPGGVRSRSGFRPGAKMARTGLERHARRPRRRSWRGARDRIADNNRNLFMFPNLVINDIMAVTVRTFYPIEPDYMAISAWALAPQEEAAGGAQIRACYNFLEFLGSRRLRHSRRRRGAGTMPEGFSNRLKRNGTTFPRAWARQAPSYDDEVQMRGSGPNGTNGSTSAA